MTFNAKIAIIRKINSPIIVSNIEDRVITRNGSELTPESAVGREFLKELSNYIWNKHCDNLFAYEDPPLNEINKHLLDYSITDIYYDFETQELVIWTNRPGIMIGVRGSEYEALNNHLKKWSSEVNLSFKKIKLKEDIYPLVNDLLYTSNLYLVNF
jgi:predicted metal-dependent RNase